MIGIAFKVVASIVAIGVTGVFLYALWIREVDVRQYATTKYWMGKWFETWFPEIPNLVKNGNFDQGAYGWGTGWIEFTPGAREFARQHRYVNLGNADARWDFLAEGGRHNSPALFVQHRSPRQNHVFSTLAQLVELKPYTQYEVRFWSKVDFLEAPGGLTVFCGVSDQTAWELGHRSDEDGPHDWRENIFRFTTDDSVFVDVRLRTESPMRAWIDDINVREVGRTPARPER